jgi:hypothetical protein
VLVFLLLLATACGAGDQGPPEYWIPQGRDVRGLATEEVFSDDELWAGINAYDARDLDHALAYLRSTSARGVYGDVGILYLASALTATGHHERALSALGRVDPNGLPPPWRDEARWLRYISLCGIGDGGIEEATRLLEELAGVDGQIGDLARAQKSRLNDR